MTPDEISKASSLLRARAELETTLLHLHDKAPVRVSTLPPETFYLAFHDCNVDADLIRPAVAEQLRRVNDALRKAGVAP